MAADPKYSTVDPKAIPTSDFYGCHNKPRPVLNQPVPSKDPDKPTYPFRFFVDCRYDLAMSDSRCKGCTHAKPFSDWHQK